MAHKSRTTLSLQDEEREERPRGRGGRLVFLVALLFLVLLAAVGFLGYQGRRRMERLEQEVAVLSGQAREASARAQIATERATLAESWARASAEGRRAAEAEAESARQETATARDAAAQSKAEAERSRKEAEAARKEAEDQFNRLEEALSKIAETRRTAEGVVMNLGSDHLKFGFDKAELRPEDRELLSRVAGILLAAKDYTISVNGHTDDVGSDAYNQKLSERRAQAVRDYLAQSGLPAGILSVTGHGKSLPLVKGTSDEARAKNRRVELGITSTRIRYGAQAR